MGERKGQGGRRRAMAKPWVREAKLVQEGDAGPNAAGGLGRAALADGQKLASFCLALPEEV